MDPNTNSTLRTRAEELIKKPTEQFVATTPAEIQQLLYELQIYQTELELQNDELRRTQVELTASRDSFSDLYDFSPVGYLTVSVSGRILAANLRAAELFGVTRSELINKIFSVYLSPTNANKLYSHYKSVQSSGTYESCELQIADNVSSGVTHIRVNSIRDRKAGDAPSSIQMTIADVTAETQAQDRLKALEQKARRADRIGDLGVIASGVAHDFNNLLTPILDYTMLSLRIADTESPIHGYLSNIKQAAEEAAEICRKMHDCVGTSTAPSVRLDPSALVNDLQPVLKTLTPHEVELTVDTIESLPGIEAERTQIDRVLMNLVINAAEAIETQGEIAITTREVQLSDESIGRLSLAGEISAGSFVQVTVADTGCGMDEITKTQIFDPFFTTKFTGRGLGMAAIAGIIRNHKAAIDVQSEAGRGTSISLYFPSCDRPAAKPVEPSVNSLASGTGSILIVDDEPLVLSAAAAILKLAGYEVHRAGSGKEAIEFFTDPDFRVDLALIDLTMPEMDGVATLQKLREIQPNIKIVLTSGFAKSTVTQRLRNQTIEGYIVKPSPAGVFTTEILRAMHGESRTIE